MTDTLAPLLARVASTLDSIERALTPAAPQPDWQAQAYLWRANERTATLRAVRFNDAIVLNDLLGVDAQKESLVTNTRQFVQGLPANNALLWGARGTGKSSLVRALLPAFAAQGLRLIEMDRPSMAFLPELIDLLAPRPERFILYCDDMSFSEGDAAYAHLKSLLDGSTATLPANVLLYATSNRRHLVVEHMKDNLESTWNDDEIHPGDTMEEKISLSERFGLWLSFYPNTQDDYLAIARAWVVKLGEAALWNDLECRTEALRWALYRGSRSGRVAAQFARHWVGSQRLSARV